MIARGCGGTKLKTKRFFCALNTEVFIILYIFYYYFLGYDICIRTY